MNQWRKAVCIRTRWLSVARSRRLCLFFCLVLLLQSSGKGFCGSRREAPRLVSLSSFTFMFNLPLEWVCNNVSLIKGIAHRVRTRDSSVGVVTRLAGIRFWVRLETRKHRDWLWGCRSIVSSGIWALFPPDQNGRSVKLTADLYLVHGLRMSGAVPPFPLYDLMPWTETTLLWHLVWRIVTMLCDAVWSGRNLPTFWKSLLLPFSK